MVEMACVSFNKVRLQYYLSKGVKGAETLNYMLREPSRLFGTTLIGVNVAMIVGSECAREFHTAIGIDPNWAPLSQVFVVIIFGELAPMFAARHYPEHVAFLGMPIIYFSSKILAPVIWILEKVCAFTLRLFGEHESKHTIFLSEEELLKILEDQDDEVHAEGDSEDINMIAANIFELRGKTVQQVMTPLSITPLLPSNATVVQMSNLLRRVEAEFIPIYHKQHGNIISIARPRDMLRASDTKRVRDFAKPPWFITQNSSLSNVLTQFRQNNENCAVVLNPHGIAVGMVTLDSLLEEIFGKRDRIAGLRGKKPAPLILKDRIFSGEMKVDDFNKEFDVDLGYSSNISLSDLIIEVVGHAPEVDDEVVIGNFNMRIVEKTLLGVKKVSISTLVY